MQTLRRLWAALHLWIAHSQDALTLRAYQSSPAVSDGHWKPIAPACDRANAPRAG